MYHSTRRRTAERCVFTLSLLSFCLLSKSFSQSNDSLKVIDLQQVTVTATMATDKTPMTFTNLKRDQIRRNDFGQDIPFLLKTTPSVVETSDAGAGVGYTGLRVRGSDATRTNVTIDGIPLNDAESQATYFVDLPDFAASASLIQIQRGVGTSTNGAGAFGATVNLVTNPPRTEGFVGYAGGVGSFGTLRNTISFGSGLMKNGLSVDGRLSRITSDGYVDRASSRLGSAYLSASFLKQKTSIRLKIFTGGERTYQSWYGIPASYLSDETLRRYNPAGTEKSGDPYPNQVDDYNQTHVHLTVNQELTSRWHVNGALHFTHGAGFYEEYKADQKLKNYFANRKDTSDLVRRLWLDNNFYGIVYAAIYKTNRVEMTTGGAWNRYDGKHYGEVIWAKSDATFAAAQPVFYRSTSTKTDFNIFEKVNYAFSEQFNGFVDLQFRQVGYRTEGVDRKQRDVGRDLSWSFFNPKAGLIWEYTEGSRFYGSLAIGHREPNRSDLVDAEKTQLPQAESLVNTEIGWRGTFGGWGLGVNFYDMTYKNQLVVNGNINDIGEQIRINVGDSYRRGVELEAAVPLANWLIFNGNAAFSENKIRDFTEYRDNWDTGGQDKIEHGTTDIAFSPNLVANAELTFSVFKNAKSELSLTPSVKFVGKQFLDNTSNDAAILEAYNYANIQIFYRLNKIRFIKNLTCKLLISNVLNAKYANNGWTYRYTSAGYDPRPDDPYSRLENGSSYNQSGYFPQATRHFMLGFSVEF